MIITSWPLQWEYVLAPQYFSDDNHVMSERLELSSEKYYRSKTYVLNHVTLMTWCLWPDAYGLTLWLDANGLWHDAMAWRLWLVCLWLWLDASLLMAYGYGLWLWFDIMAMIWRYGYGYAWFDVMAGWLMLMSLWLDANGISLWLDANGLTLWHSAYDLLMLWLDAMAWRYGMWLIMWR